MLRLDELLYCIKSGGVIYPDNIEFADRPTKCKLAMIGDIHGDRPSYMQLTSKASYSIQVGDMYNSSGVHHMVSERSHEDHKYISGNHDWFADDFVQPKHNLGDYGVWKINKLSLDVGFIRGANSIDKDRRFTNLYDPWHPEEELSYSELQEAVDYIVATRPGVLVTHMAPTCVHAHLRLYSGYGLVQSRTMVALESLFMMYQPRLWVFGHYHQNMTCSINGTAFACVNINEMLPIV